MPWKMILSFAVSLAIVMATMPRFIKFLKKLSFRQTISEYSLQDDQKKAGTPIMGGILFIVVPVLVSVIVNPSSLKDMDTMIVILAFLGYGIIGFIDDYLIAVKKNNDGLSAKAKLLMQFMLAIIFFMIYRRYAGLEIDIPFTSHIWYMGAGYFFLVLFMFAGSSNAVNLTDGMDGLCAGVTLLALCPFLVFALQQGMAHLGCFITALMGGLLGYLYYNKKPARVFMGDTGALALGGLLAALAMVMKKEIALIVIAGIPVIETLSVIIQVAAVKTIHRRVFPYTPIHYSFRIKGMSEQNVVRLFWIVEAVFALIGLWIGLH